MGNRYKARSLIEKGGTEIKYRMEPEGQHDQANNPFIVVRTGTMKRSL